MQKKMKILVTGGAGFIGHALCMQLRQRDELAITWIDRERYIGSFRDIFSSDKSDPIADEQNDIQLDRVDEMGKYKALSDESRLDLSDKKNTLRFVHRVQPDIVFHLAALPGVLPSMVNPADYVLHNSCAFANVLEACHACGSVQHLLFASSSSVYGSSKRMREDAPLPPPANIYAATKQMDEHVAKLYGKRRKLPVTAMRFFTVYGPLGRADMAVHKVLRAAWGGRDAFLLNGDGSSRRSFTFIDDVVEAMCRLMPLPPAGEQEYFRAVNIGAEESHSVREMIACVEQAYASYSAPFGRKILTQIRQMPSNAEEAVHTKADCTLLRELTGYAPRTSLPDGIKKTAEWYTGWWMKRRRIR